MFCLGRQFYLIFGQGLLLATVVFSAEEKRLYTSAPFENYQIILDRMPFGRPPPAQSEMPLTPEEAAAQKAAAEEEKNLAKNVVLTCINMTPGGQIAVGFSVNVDKSASNYYLRSGESQDGWSILAANYGAETATLKKGSVVITLQLGKGLVDTPTNLLDTASAALSAAAAVSNEPAQPAPPSSILPVGLQHAPRPEGGAERPKLAIPGLTYSQRRQNQVQLEAEKAAAQAKEEDRKRKEAFDKIAQEAAAKALENLQQQQAEALERQQAEQMQHAQTEQPAAEQQQAPAQMDGQQQQPAQ
jgi:hypothetical protein